MYGGSAIYHEGKGFVMGIFRCCLFFLFWSSEVKYICLIILEKSQVDRRVLCVLI